MPIETAPKAGPLIDLYGTRNGVPQRFPDAKWSEHIVGGMEMGTFSWSHRGWDRYGEFTYTHWMPLPDPPVSP